MDNNDVFELFLSGMLDNAVKDFQSTDQHTLLREKLDRMEEDCKGMFNKDQQDFALECFNLLLDVSGQEETYVYKQGIHDGIYILKTLGVLA